MKKHMGWILGSALMAAVVTGPAFPQSSPATPRPIAQSLKVQLLFTKGEGDKKASSPYSFFTTSSGETLSLRIGTEVPVGAALEQIGTQIDSSVTAAGDGRFNLVLNFKGRFLSPEGPPREFTASKTLTLRDGESTKFTGSDDKGEAFTLDVTLTVVK
jgi:hypothetical protein